MQTQLLEEGVLEAEGLVSIKLRLREQREMMNRLDPEMKLLQQQLPSQSPEDIKNKMKEREELWLQCTIPSRFI